MSNTATHNIAVNISANASSLTSTVATANTGLTALGNNPAPQTLRAALRTAQLEAQRLLLANQQNTQAYRDQTREIARLRDAQVIFNASIPDAGNALAGVSRAAQIVSGSIAALSPVFKSVFPDAGGLIDGLVASLGGVSAAIGVIDTIGDVEDVLSPYIDGLRAAAVASNTLATAANAGAAVQNTSTIALLANVAATNIAKAATIAYNFVLNKIPLFAIITAVGLVITGFILFKDTIYKLLPGLESLINAGTKAVQMFTDFVGITSEASRVADAFSASIKKVNADLEYQNKILAAKGDNERLIYQNSRKILDNTISDLKLKAKADDEYNAKYYEALNKAIQDRNILDVKETKRIADITKKRADDAQKVEDEAAKKAKAKADELAKKGQAEEAAKNAALKKVLADADKIRTDSQLSERKLSENAINLKYDNDIKTTTKKYGEFSKQTLSLVEAKNLELAVINDKYVQLLDDNEQDIKNKNLDDYEKRILDIQKKYDDLAKNDPNNKDTYVKRQTEEYKVVRTEQTLNTSITNIDDALGDTTLSPSDREALENEKLAEQYAAGTISKKQYENDKNRIEAEASKARQDIDDAEAATKEKNLQNVAGFLNDASALAGESTIAGKGLAIASATISTYLSAQKAYESLIGIPFVGPTLAPIAAGVAVAGGLASIKKIVSVKVPTTTGSTSTGVSTPSFSANSAPVINSTKLEDRGIQDVRVTESATKADTAPIKAYIVSSDLDTKEQQDRFNDSFSRV